MEYSDTKPDIDIFWQAVLNINPSKGGVIFDKRALYEK